MKTYFSRLIGGGGDRVAMVPVVISVAITNKNNNNGSKHFGIKCSISSVTQRDAVTQRHCENLKWCMAFTTTADCKKEGQTGSSKTRALALNNFLRTPNRV